VHGRNGPNHGLRVWHVLDGQPSARRQHPSLGFRWCQRTWPALGDVFCPARDERCRPMYRRWPPTSSRYPVRISSLMLVRQVTDVVLMCTCLHAFIPRTSSANPVNYSISFQECQCRLTSEKLILKVTDSLLTVSGEYFFRQLANPGNPERKEIIVFPFLGDSSMGTPTLLDATISVDGRHEDALRVDRRSHMWFWDMKAATCSTMVSIQFTQRLTARRAGYLLTSCQSWVAPLDSVRISVDVSLPPGRRPHFSLPLEPGPMRERGREYSGTFRNWMPDHDLIIRW
jgi:hypothetical protein